MHICSKHAVFIDSGKLISGTNLEIHDFGKLVSGTNAETRDLGNWFGKLVGNTSAIDFQYVYFLSQENNLWLEINITTIPLET